MKICAHCGSKYDIGGWQCPSCNLTPESTGGYLSFSPQMAEFNSSFNSDYFDQLYVLEAGNFWFRSRNRLIIYALEKYFSNADSFLEIGCGTGLVLSAISEKFPRLKSFGSDIFTKGVIHAAKRIKNAELFQMDARNIPFENEFDVIGAFDVLEHIQDDTLVLSEIHKALRNDGGIILTVPQHGFLWSSTDEYACHVRRYSHSDLRTKIERAGFKIIRTTSFVSLLFPLMVLSRLGQRKKEHIYDELKISGYLNALLEKVMDIERGLIVKGMSFPFGGSLLLTARKISGGPK